MKRLGYILTTIVLSFCSVLSITLAQENRIETSGASQPSYEIHIVEKGDDLHLIAAIYYNNARLWNVIYMANKDTIKNPNLIYKGQRLVIPIYIEE